MSEGNGLPEWAASLPEALHSTPYLKDAATPEAFLEQVQNAAAWQGNSIRMPGPDAGEEDISAFQAKVMEKVPGLMLTPNMEDTEAVDAIFGKLGRPDAPENYRLPEGVEIDGDALGNMKAQAHKVGMTQAQFERQVALMTEQGGEQQAARDAMLAEQKAIMQKEWGPAYEERMNTIGAFLKDAPAEIADAFANGSLNADNVRWLYSMSLLGEESGQQDSQQDGSSRAMTPDEIQGQLSELEKRIFARDSQADPAYQSWVNKRLALLEMLNPNHSAELDAWRSAG